jgi:molybdopterin-guanine dinucleotide biosynthesis protein A
MSLRMGTDKALLAMDGRTLAEHVAEAVREAAGSVALIGDPARYGHLGYRVVADNFSGSGPLAGIEAALRVSAAEWNLVAACDMPCVSVELFRLLLERAAGSEADCILPQGPSGRPEPLCAVYHRRCLPAVADALARGQRKVTAALGGLRVSAWVAPESVWFQNVNTPGEWAPYANG